MEWAYNSTQFEKDPEMKKAIELHRWRCYINKGHYERRKGVIYFDDFCYNLMRAEIGYRRNVKKDEIRAAINKKPR